jgi:hypothetical protein
MPGAETEFGGKPQRNGVQPPPHIPTPSEMLMLGYRTGDPSGQTMPDSGEVFSGLSPYDVQLARRTAEGAMDKGQVAAELEIAAQALIAELAAESAAEQ